MEIRRLALFAGALIIVGCSKDGAASKEAAEAAAPVAAKARTASLNTGQTIRVRTTTTLSTKANKAGETFMATLEEPVVDGDWVIAAKGATVEGRIVESDQGGRVKGRAEIAVRLVSLTSSDGQKIEIHTGSAGREAQATKGKDAAKVGIGAGVGAAIGAIAGGGKGAGIGAAVGAGAGTGTVLATRGDAATIPAETVLTFKLREAVTVTKK